MADLGQASVHVRLTDYTVCTKISPPPEFQFPQSAGVDQLRICWSRLWGRALADIRFYGPNCQSWWEDLRGDVPLRELGISHSLRFIDIFVY